MYVADDDDLQYRKDNSNKNVSHIVNEIKRKLIYNNNCKRKEKLNKLIRE